MHMRRRWLVPLGALAALAFPATAAAHAGGHAVFTLANGASGNRVLVFARGSDGTLSPAGAVATGGAGTGVTATTQGALVLSPDGLEHAGNGLDRRLVGFLQGTGKGPERPPP